MWLVLQVGKELADSLHDQEVAVPRRDVKEEPVALSALHREFPFLQGKSAHRLRSRLLHFRYPFKSGCSSKQRSSRALTPMPAHYEPPIRVGATCPLCKPPFLEESCSSASLWHASLLSLRAKNAGGDVASSRRLFWVKFLFSFLPRLWGQEPVFASEQSVFVEREPFLSRFRLHLKGYLQGAVTRRKQELVSQLFHRFG